MISNQKFFERSEPVMTKRFNVKLIHSYPAIQEEKYRGRPVLTFKVPVDEQGKPVLGYQQNLVNISFEEVYGRAKQYGE